VAVWPFASAASILAASSWLQPFTFETYPEYAKSLTSMRTVSCSLRKTRSPMPSDAMGRNPVSPNVRPVTGSDEGRSCTRVFAAPSPPLRYTPSRRILPSKMLSLP